VTGDSDRGKPKETDERRRSPAHQKPLRGKKRRGKGKNEKEEGRRGEEISSVFIDGTRLFVTGDSDRGKPKETEEKNVVQPNKSRSAEKKKRKRKKEKMRKRRGEGGEESEGD